MQRCQAPDFGITWASSALLRASLTRGASLLEPARLPIQLLEVAAQLFARLLPLPGQPHPIPDVPGAQDRSQHLVSVDPQVVDAGHGDLHRAASEALNGVTGHLECADDV